MPLAAKRLLVVPALVSAALWAQEPTPAEPPEEDESLAVQEYTFNPIQAQKEIQVGNYYMRKGSYRAAAGRFQEATRWNQNSSEAYLRLGEAHQKLKDEKAMREAWKRYLELEPQGKDAARIRKLLAAKR